MDNNQAMLNAVITNKGFYNIVIVKSDGDKHNRMFVSNEEAVQHFNMIKDSDSALGLNSYEEITLEWVDVVVEYNDTPILFDSK